MNEREAVFAHTFFEHDQWEYEARVFRLSPHCSYTPDFYDAKRDVYIEVVGSRQAYNQNKVKYDFFQTQYPELKFELRRPDGEIFINRKRMNLYCHEGIAKQIGIHQSTLSNILTGRRRSSWDLAKRLAEFTGTHPDIWMEKNLAAMQEAIEEALKRKLHGRTV